MHLVYYSIQIPSCRIMGSRDFPGGPVGMTLCFRSWGTASIPGQGTKNLQGAAKKKKKKVYIIEGKTFLSAFLVSIFGAFTLK